MEQKTQVYFGGAGFRIAEIANSFSFGIDSCLIFSTWFVADETYRTYYHHNITAAISLGAISHNFYGRKLKVKLVWHLFVPPFVEKYYLKFPVGDLAYLML